MENNQDELKLGDKLALQRTALAQERTLMASVRTSVSLISFGFTISKFFQQLRQHEVLGGTGHSSRAVGLWLVAIGTGYILLSSIQHILIRKELKQEGASLRASYSLLLGIVVTLLGLALVISYYTNFLKLNLNNV